MAETVILGIDPGTIKTGYGVIRVAGSHSNLVDYGVIRPPAKLELFDRYYILFESLKQILNKYQPHEVCVETQFVQKNVQSAMKIGMARGVVIVAAKSFHLDCFEYTPKQAKLALVGTGSASKSQVIGMLKRRFNLKEDPPEDAADALSLAVCHAHKRKSVV
jgi:crossover junction endodeoxyribonuclease RuvC